MSDDQPPPEGKCGGTGEIVVKTVPHETGPMVVKRPCPGCPECKPPSQTTDPLDSPEFKAGTKEALRNHAAKKYNLCKPPEGDGVVALAKKAAAECIRAHGKPDGGKGGCRRLHEHEMAQAIAEVFAPLAQERDEARERIDLCNRRISEEIGNVGTWKGRAERAEAECKRLREFCWEAARIFRRQGDLGFAMKAATAKWRDTVLPVLKSALEHEPKGEENADGEGSPS